MEESQSFDPDDPLLRFRERAEIALAMLTPQQSKILELAATDPGPKKENTNEVVAVELKLSSSSIEKHIRNARKIIGGDNRDAAIKQFIVLRTLAGTRNSDFRPLDITPAMIEHTISQISSELAVRLHGSPELEQLAAELRGTSGWKMFDLKFDRWWRAIAIPVGALFLLILLGSFLMFANAVNQVNDPTSSSTQVGDEIDVTTEQQSTDDQR